MDPRSRIAVRDRLRVDDRKYVRMTGRWTHVKKSLNEVCVGTTTWVMLMERSLQWYAYAIMVQLIFDWNILKKYKGTWIAFADDETTVVASAKTLKETLEKAKKKGYKNPRVMDVPREMLPFMGICSDEIRIR